MQMEISKIKIHTSKQERARTDFGDIQGLALSIKTYGLIQPICVAPIEGADIDGIHTHVLIAGERRLRALSFLGILEVEVTDRTDTTDIKRKSMELEENIARKDMHWFEQQKCISQLHALKQVEFGTRSNDHTKQDGWGIRETANLTGHSVGSISAAIKTVEILKNRPDLKRKIEKLPKAAAGTALRRILRAEEMQEKVKHNDITISAELWFGNCMDLIDRVPDNSIDCLITDPPFGNPGIVEQGVTDKAAYNIVESNVSTVEILLATMKVLIPKLTKKLKKGAHVYMFTGMGEPYYEVMCLLRANGFIIDDLPLIWDKGRPSVIAKDYSYVSCYEAVMFGHFGEKTKRLMKPVSNILRFDAVPGQKRVHPLQRPEGILELMIENSTDVGDMILDCFAGSGSTLFAARRMQRRSIGFELDEGNYATALNWLQETEADENPVKG